MELTYAPEFHVLSTTTNHESFRAVVIFIHSSMKYGLCECLNCYVLNITQIGCSAEWKLLHFIIFIHTNFKLLINNIIECLYIRAICSNSMKLFPKQLLLFQQLPNAPALPCFIVLSSRNKLAEHCMYTDRCNCFPAWLLSGAVLSRQPKNEFIFSQYAPVQTSNPLCRVLVSCDFFFFCSVLWFAGE